MEPAPEPLSKAGFPAVTPSAWCARSGFRRHRLVWRSDVCRSLASEETFKIDPPKSVTQMTKINLRGLAPTIPAWPVGERMMKNRSPRTD
jgi:hypothetical protein